MPKHKIENLLNTQLILEDLGITLAPKGGADSIGYVDSGSFERSRSVRENVRHIRVTPIPDVVSPRPIKLWGIQKAVPPPPPPEPSALPVVSVDNGQQLKSVVNQVDGLDKKVDEVIRMLRLGITVGGAGQGIPNIPTPEAASTSGFSEPMYFPKSIASGQVGDSNIQVSSQTTDASSFDEAAAALKNLKKIKKV